MNDAANYTDPAVLAGLGSMELVAKYAVEGFFSGRHCSPACGFSVEYSDRRDYQPGDDTRHIDWRAYARSNRLFVKQFHQETNTTVHLLLDSSESMNFSGDRISKGRYGRFICASLACLGLRQNDSVSLVKFSDRVIETIPASSKKSQLTLILRSLETVETGLKTDIGRSLRLFAERVTRRGLVVVVSDFLNADDCFRHSLAFLRHRRHDVIVFHVLDRRELEFDYHGPVMFEDMESGQTVSVTAGAVKNAYRRRIDDYLESFRCFCGTHEIDYCIMNTQQSIDGALRAYLSRRNARL